MNNRRAAGLLGLILSAFLVFSCKVGDFANVCDLTIKYYYNDEDMNLKSSDVVMRMNLNSKLEGSPSVWTDGRWVNNIDYDVEYGFVGDGATVVNGQVTVKGRKYNYNISDGNIWKFKTINGVDWDSSRKITRSVSLVPLYEMRDDGNVDWSVVFCTQKADASSDLGYVFKFEDRVLDAEDVSQGRFILADIEKNLAIFTQDYNDVYGYGYEDKTQHNKLFFFDKNPNLNAYEYYVYDSNMNKIEGVTINSMTVLTPELDGYILVPKYVNIGYTPIRDDDPRFGLMTGAAEDSTGWVEQVFIPGNLDENGNRRPFPYGHISDGRSAMYQKESSDLVDIRRTDIDIPDMYVMDIDLPSSLVISMLTDTTMTGLGYVINPTNFAIPQAEGEQYGTAIRYYTCQNLNQWDCFVLANMLTDWYNLKHPNERPLTPVYHNVTTMNNPTLSASTILRKTYDTANSKDIAFDDPWKMDGNNFIYIDENATGFRLPYDVEWEYMARIVTDERQVPTDRTYIITPDEDNGYMYYFQSGKGDLGTGAGQDYTGSGAGLAYWDVTKYDQSILRTFAQASGRSNKSEKKSNTGDLMKKNALGVYDRNRMNGAGLYGITGCWWQWTNTVYVDASTSANANRVLRGGSYGLSASSNAYRLRLASVGYSAPSDRYASFGVRFVRTL